MSLGVKRFLLAVCGWSAFAILASVSAATPTLADSRLCATATIHESFVTPNGAEHAPGKLTLCRGRFSPSRAMHVGYVDGASVGMFFSERGRSEAPTDDEPFMMFARDRAGRLHLYGFSAPCRDGMETFLFSPLRHHELGSLRRADPQADFFATTHPG